MIDVYTSLTVLIIHLEQTINLQISIIHPNYNNNCQNQMITEIQNNDT